MKEAFERDGYVRIDDAFPRAVADECRAILWRETGCDPDDPSTWTKPVIRLGERMEPCFREAASTGVVRAAFDELCGVGTWLPRGSLGSFPIRFPSPEDPGDGGWHVDGGFAGADEADFFAARINARSKGRRLLMLFLFSEVGPADAPTRILPGSHRAVTKLLEPHGEAGLSFMELARAVEALPRESVALATGSPGTVYLCHPHLVHAAQPHRGTRPKFMAQPTLLPAPPGLIFHIVERSKLTWDVEARYRPASLESEGFVHGSYREKVAESARLYFAPDADLAVLALDPAKLDARVEIAETPRGPMPHIHGPIPRTAIVAVYNLRDF